MVSQFAGLDNTRLSKNNMSDEDYINRKEDLQEQIRAIRDNHLAHLSNDVNDIKVKLAVQGEALEWLKKMTFIVATATIGSLTAGLLNLL